MVTIKHMEYSNPAMHHRVTSLLPNNFYNLILCSVFHLGINIRASENSAGG